MFFVDTYEILGSKFPDSPTSEQKSEPSATVDDEMAVDETANSTPKFPDSPTSEQEGKPSATLGDEMAVDETVNSTPMDYTFSPHLNSDVGFVIAREYSSERSIPNNFGPPQSLPRSSVALATKKSCWH